ncbi:hypothetical protein OC834_001801 [Tilletia horrida]|nr:hypothetical protein OC834_001801 [Tilletia horrida]
MPFARPLTGDKWAVYLNLLVAGNHEGDALTEIGLKRYCCRRMILTHVDLIEKLLQYNTQAIAIAIAAAPRRAPLLRLVQVSALTALRIQSTRSKTLSEPLFIQEEPHTPCTIDVPTHHFSQHPSLHPFRNTGP